MKTFTIIKSQKGESNEKEKVIDFNHHNDFYNYIIYYVQKYNAKRGNQ